MATIVTHKGILVRINTEKTLLNILKTKACLG